jgi:hypothetical protein
MAKAKGKPAPPAKPKTDAGEIIRRSLAAQYARKAAAGQNLKPEEWRLLLEDRDREHTWPDRKACSDELSVAFGRVIGLRQLYEWKRHGAPLPTKGPIYKADMWRWFAVEKREKGRPGEGGEGSASLREQKLEKEVAILAARLSSLTGTMLDAGEAQSVMVTAMQDLRNALRHDLPARAVAASVSMGVEDATDSILGMIDEILSNLAVASERFRAREPARVH